MLDAAAQTFICLGYLCLTIVVLFFCNMSEQEKTEALFWDNIADKVCLLLSFTLFQPVLYAYCTYKVPSDVLRSPAHEIAYKPIVTPVGALAKYARLLLSVSYICCVIFHNPFHIFTLILLSFGLGFFYNGLLIIWSTENWSFISRMVSQYEIWVSRHKKEIDIVTGLMWLVLGFLIGNWPGLMIVACFQLYLRSGNNETSANVA